MKTNAFVCRVCRTPFEASDAFCAVCGNPSGQITWSLSSVREPKGESSILIRPGDTFYLIAANVGLSPVRVEVDVSGMRGATLEGIGSGAVAAAQWLAFPLTHTVGAELGGLLTLRSRDAQRKDWWQRSDWRGNELRLPHTLRVREERWILGCETIVFPPDAPYQSLRIWNDAERVREFAPDTPAGFRVRYSSTTPTIKLGAGQSAELLLQPLGKTQSGSPDTSWRLGDKTLPIVRMDSAKREPGADAIVAIDFGTRNTGIRIRWRRTLVAGKPDGTIDSIGDTANSARFPTEMVIEKNDRRVLWGSAAADAIRGNRLNADEFPVENLKTFLREGREGFTEYGAKWTNQEILNRYVVRIIARLDDYLHTSDLETPLSRAGIRLQFVVTRPVLDFNTGDVIGGQYENALRSAFVKAGVDADTLVFALEPVAAAIGIARRRASELLALQGKTVAVIDSGGGTTDISLARVNLENGRVALEIVGSDAVALASNSPAQAALRWFGLAEQKEFGGNVLDAGLAYQLVADARRLLESDGQQPIPPRLDFYAPQGTVAPQLARAWKRGVLDICRKMKESFSQSSRMYLNRPAGQAPKAGEVVPFPNRPDYAGVSLEHALIDDYLFAPLLRPALDTLQSRMISRQAETDGVSPNEIAKVFYVGGTNCDGFVRLHFGRLFPNAPAETDADAQSPERIAERLNAVVEGAIWFDEQVYTPAPLTLTVHLGERQEIILEQGAALLPSGMAASRFLTTILEPFEEIDAQLIASAESLPKPLVVARAFYRNTTDTAQDVTLRVMASKDRGAVAVVLANGKPFDQWRFVLGSN